MRTCLKNSFSTTAGRYQVNALAIAQPWANESLGSNNCRIRPVYVGIPRDAMSDCTTGSYLLFGCTSPENDSFDVNGHHGDRVCVHIRPSHVKKTAYETEDFMHSYVIWLERVKCKGDAREETERWRERERDLRRKRRHGDPKSLPPLTVHTSVVKWHARHSEHVTTL